MMRDVFLLIVLMFWVVIGYCQPSMTQSSVIYPCTDSESWVIGGFHSIGGQSSLDSTFKTIDVFSGAIMVTHNEIDMLVLDSSGRIHGRGHNPRGELGLGDTLPRYEFEGQIDAPLMDTVILEIFGSWALSKDSGAVYYWGYRNSALFRDTNEVAKNVTRSPYRIFKGYYGYSKISVAQDFILLLREDGALYGYGGNEKSQLGEAQGSYIRKPTFLGLVGIKDIYAGESHSMALDSAGHVFCFGHNILGQCGVDPDQNYFVSTPNQLEVEDVVFIAGGKLASYAVTASGDVFAWGLGTLGGMGNGDSTYANFEAQKVLIDSVKRVFAHNHYVIAERYNGDYFGWGLDSQGLFGLNNTGVKHFVPIKLPTQCLTTDILETNREDVFLVYPNPSANGVFSLSKASSWKVFNNLGQEVVQGNGSLVDLSSKADGFYFLWTEGNTGAKMLVKN